MKTQNNIQTVICGRVSYRLKILPLYKLKISKHIFIKHLMCQVLRQLRARQEPSLSLCLFQFYYSSVKVYGLDSSLYFCLFKYHLKRPPISSPVICLFQSFPSFQTEHPITHIQILRTGVIINIHQGQLFSCMF